jgi:hypothetical protein
MRCMWQAIALVALVGIGCSGPETADLADGLGLDGGSPPMQGDGGAVPDGDSGELSDAALAGFRKDSGVDAGAPEVDAGHDAGVDAGPCYPPEGLDHSVIQLACDVCPESGCLPVIWSGSIGSGTKDGLPGVISATAFIYTDLHSLGRVFSVKDHAQAVIIDSGDFFEHLYQGLPITTAVELELDREPWAELGSSLPGQGNAKIPSYMRIAALVTDDSAVFAWTMHRAPD